MPKLGAQLADDDLRLSAWPAGVVKVLTTSAVPTGWLICRGALVATATYPLLFAKIGHKYNRDGSGNIIDPGSGQFKLPDFQRRIPIGPSGTAKSHGRRGGTFDHVHLQGTLAASHSHGVGSLLVADHDHSHNFAMRDHNHVVTETVKTVLGGSNAGRAFGGRSLSSGAWALGGGIFFSGTLTPTGSSVSVAPTISGQTGVANPPVIVVNFIIRTGEST